MFFFWRSGRSMQYHTFATLSSKLCTKKIPMVSEFLMSSRHHSCTSVAVPALPTCNLSVHSYLGKPPRSYTKKVSATSRCQLNGYELRGKSQSLPKSDCVLSPSSLSCWYLFFVYQVVSPYSCVWFHATFDASFQNPFFHPPVFPLKDPTAPLGLSNSTRSFSPDSMLPGSCPEPSCNKHTIRETNVTILAPKALTTSQRKGLVMWDTSRNLMNQNS